LLAEASRSAVAGSSAPGSSSAALALQLVGQGGAAQGELGQAAHLGGLPAGRNARSDAEAGQQQEGRDRQQEDQGDLGTKGQVAEYRPSFRGDDGSIDTEPVGTVVGFVSSQPKRSQTRWMVQQQAGGWGRRRGTLRVLALVAAALLAAGCTGGRRDPGRPGEAPPAAEGLTDLGRRLPQRIQTAREVRVGSDVLDRPVGDPEPQVRGIDPDLATELGRRLGVRFTFVNTAFDELIPALKAGKFDLIISSMTATPERAKEIGFLEYFQAGTSILVASGNPKRIGSMADLCGRTVTLQAGTIHEELVAAQQARCGARRINARPLDSGTQVVLEVKFGRADAALADFPVAAYNAKVSGQGHDFQVVGEQIDPGPYGIGVRKDDAELQSVLQEALREIIADGSYDRVLTNWNVTDGALKTAAMTGDG
jgi:polar amino acid transport system substrate-binding protein